MNDDSDYEDRSEEKDLKDEESIFIEKELTECFATFDQKGTGLMPSKFLEKALGSLGILLTPTELEEILLKIDREGFVELSDFIAFGSEKLAEIDSTMILKAAFAVFDPEKEGMVPTDRFKKLMTTLGDPLTDSEAKELCKMGDPINNGLFLYEEVIHKLIN